METSGPGASFRPEPRSSSKSSLSPSSDEAQAEAAPRERRSGAVEQFQRPKARRPERGAPAPLRAPSPPPSRFPLCLFSPSFLSVVLVASLWLRGRVVGRLRLGVWFYF